MVPARTRSPLATVSPSTIPTQLHVVPARRYLLAQTLVSSEFRVPVIPVGSAAEVVAFIKTMHEQEQHSTPRTTWKPLPDRRQYDEMVLVALTAVPGLGQKTAEKLLSRFPSLKLIANADESALVAWIGDGPGRAVHTYFHS
eukprot:m.183684 g.183684  ORF g.183684 m.183684 type:complete len:142 (-) comp24664_c0_seq1:302-727(-)